MVQVQATHGEVDYQCLAQRIAEEVQKTLFVFKRYIFLCGKSTDDRDSLRYCISEVFKTNPKFHYRYELIYPEILYGEYLSGPHHLDLITIENHIASSVDAVVILLESAGAIAELGAFVNHEQLRKKMICVLDNKRKKDKSFINYGPIRMLKDSQSGKVIYADFTNTDKIAYNIDSAVKNLQDHMHNRKTINALNAHSYLLPCMYVFETLDHDSVERLVQWATASHEEDNSKVISAAAIKMMLDEGNLKRIPNALSVNKHSITEGGNGYELTKAGIELFLEMNQRSRRSYYFSQSTLDGIRLLIISIKYRNRKGVTALRTGLV